MNLGALAKLLDIELSAASSGRASCQLTVRAELLNPNGSLHGGTIYTMVDYAMGAASTSLLDAEATCATIEIKISYLAAVRAGVVRCEARVLKKGRQVIFLSSDVTDDAGTLVAAASGSFLVVTPRLE